LKLLLRRRQSTIPAFDRSGFIVVLAWYFYEKARTIKLKIENMHKKTVIWICIIILLVLIVLAVFKADIDDKIKLRP